jgi:putative SOS response-associated peptidase YedK
VILADGFYEWRALPNSRVKQPMLIQLRSHEVFALAGLWDRWTPADGGEILFSTIITTVPDNLMAEIHNRMPVILQPEAISLWLLLDRLPPERLTPFWVPYPDSELEAFSVSRLVNKPGVDLPECIRPLT